MKLFLQSNFVIPGFEDKEFFENERSVMTVREFLHELSIMSGGEVEYLVPGAQRLDPDDWELEINDVPYQKFSEGVERGLKEGDRITLRIVAQGGG